MCFTALRKHIAILVGDWDPRSTQSQSSSLTFMNFFTEGGDTTGTGTTAANSPLPPPPEPSHHQQAQHTWELAHEHRRRQWAFDAVWRLWDHLAPWHNRAVTLHYGGECSGAEAGLVACKDLADALGELLGAQVHIIHEYSSEHPGKEGDGPRKWLFANARPRRMYRDLHCRASADSAGGVVDYVDADLESQCTVIPVASGSGYVKMCPPPPPSSMQLLIGGYVCKDNSTANRHRKLALASAPGSRDPDGQSSCTYQSTVHILLKERPERFLLENTGQAPAEATVNHLRSQLSDYFVLCLRSEALDFGAAARRNRVWIVGAQKRLVKVPVSEWPNIVASLCTPPASAPRPPCSVHACSACTCARFSLQAWQPVSVHRALCMCAVCISIQVWGEPLGWCCHQMTCGSALCRSSGRT